MTTMKVSDLAEHFKVILGDSSADVTDEFIINALNWAFRELPKVPKLDKIFNTHQHFNLDANEHYRWSINCGFRKITDIGMLCFYSSTGGEPCKMPLCYKEPTTFFEKNGIIELKKKGIPCEYTIEVEGDESYLVLDRPSEIPIIIDIICCGYPMPVSSMDDEIDLSAPLEHLIISLLQTVWYRESSDFSFADNISLYIDSKAIPEVLQLIHKRYGVGTNAILGESN